MVLQRRLSINKVRRIMKIISYIHVRFCLLLGLFCLTIMANAQGGESFSKGVGNLSLFYECSMGNDNEFNADDVCLEIKDIYNANILLMYEHVLNDSRQTTSSLLFGIGCSRICVDANYMAPLYTFVTDQDIDGDTYSREYYDLNLSQKAKGASFILSLGLRNKLKLSKHFSIYNDLGFNGLMFSSLKLKKSEGSSNVYGKYSQYENIIFDGTWGYNGFGKANLSNANLITNVDVNGFVPISFVRLGLEISCSNSCLLYIGTTYQHAMRDLIKHTCGDSNVNLENAYVFNTMDNAESLENVRSVLGSCQKSRLAGFMLSIGGKIYF